MRPDTDFGGDVTTMSLDEKKRALSSMRETLEEHFVTLGQLLNEIKKDNIFRLYGYETFKDFVEDEFNLAGALANRLVNNYKYYVEKLDLDEHTLIQIGLDKLNLLRPVLKEASIQEQEIWLEKAQTEKTTQLKSDLKEKKEREKDKKKNMQEVFTDQFIERMITHFSCSRKELMFRLAVFFQDRDLDEIDQSIKERLAKIRDSDFQT
ncbi:MAG: hypothetical protein WCX83_01750 [Candidatus Cloacimonas sp.]|nr:hypothetical protein [Candidatus Cloacimonadota bacterium]